MTSQKAPSAAQVRAMRYWADTEAAPCYRGGTRATVAALVRRGLLLEPQGMTGHRLTEAGYAALAAADARIEGHARPKVATVKLTKAQAHSLRQMAEHPELTRYMPSNIDWAPRHSWRSYSYERFDMSTRRGAVCTKSVDKLVALGLADHPSNSKACRVTATAAGLAWLAANPASA